MGLLKSAWPKYLFVIVSKPSIVQLYLILELFVFSLLYLKMVSLYYKYMHYNMLFRLSSLNYFLKSSFVLGDKFLCKHLLSCIWTHLSPYPFYHNWNTFSGLKNINPFYLYKKNSHVIENSIVEKSSGRIWGIKGIDYRFQYVTHCQCFHSLQVLDWANISTSSKNSKYLRL